MKKVITLIVLFALLTSAQVKFGITGGLNMSNFSGTDAGNSDLRYGFVAGVFIDKGGDGLGLRAELLYSMKGAELSQSTAERGIFVYAKVSAEYDYLELPLLAKYTIDIEGETSPVLYAGPYFGMLLSSTANIKATVNGNYGQANSDIYDQNTFDAGLMFGGGFTFDLGKNKLSLIVRYSLGLLNINSNSNVNNNCFSIMTGLTF